MTKVVEATKALPTRKAPRVNGIPVKFFQRVINQTQEDLWNLVNEVFQKFILCRSININRINLIPKFGSLIYINNFKPISLLGTIYKIVAKIIANETVFFVPLWIKKWQTAFVPKKSIFDIIFMANEAMDWTILSKQKTVILLLDYDKAHDRVCWKFLEEAMLQMGFDPQRVKLINTLYKKNISMCHYEWARRQSNPNTSIYQRRMSFGTILIPIYERCFWIHAK